MIPSKFCIVMPIVRGSYILQEGKKKSSTARHDNFERFFRIGWPTLLDNIVWQDVATFFVIVRDDEKEIFQTYINNNVQEDLQSKFELVAQEELITVPDMEKTRVQMLSKILIATRMPTKHYLIIDDDVVALRRFSYNDIFTDKSHRYVRYTHDETFHEGWFRGSADALEVSYDNVLAHELNNLRKQKRILSVTPGIFITEQSLSLLNKLKDLHGTDNYQSKLSIIKGRWSEYTLMWIHLMQQGSVTNWYRCTRVRLSDNNRNIWYASQNLTESLRKMWVHPRPYFGVIQSNVPEHTVENVLAAMQTK